MIIKLDDLLNFNHTYFEWIVTQIYRTELQLNEANSTHTEAPVSDLHLSVRMVLFHPKFMANAKILILILLVSCFWMATFIVPLLMLLYLSTYLDCKSV